jgi:hypothetical protein
VAHCEVAHCEVALPRLTPEWFAVTRFWAANPQFPLNVSSGVAKRAELWLRTLDWQVVAVSG